MYDGVVVDTKLYDVGEGAQISEFKGPMISIAGPEISFGVVHRSEPSPTITQTQPPLVQ